MYNNEVETKKDCGNKKLNKPKTEIGNMMRLFNFKKETKTRRSIFLQTEATMPIEIMVAIGKHHVVGIAELGDKSITIEKPTFPFTAPPEPEEIAKELLKKLGIPESEWDEILKTKREVAI
jgi:hypothetical protein